MDTVPSRSARLGSPIILLVVIAGSIWGLFNTAIAMVFSFGISLLMEQGWTITSGGSIISLVLWLTIFTIPLGGLVADRIKSKGLLIAVSTPVASPPHARRFANQLSGPDS